MWSAIAAWPARVVAHVLLTLVAAMLAITGLTATTETPAGAFRYDASAQTSALVLGAAAGSVPITSATYAETGFFLAAEGAMASRGRSPLGGILSDETNTIDASLYEADVARFGNLPGVNVLNLPDMAAEEVRALLNGPGTTIGAFCDSGACLAGFR